MPVPPAKRLSAPAAAASPDDLPRMPLLSHLEELRKRILAALLTVAVAFAPCWYFVEKIFAFLALPIQKLLPPGTKLAFLGVTDPFILYFKVAALAAIFLSAPFLIYQLWSFISPALYRKEKRFAIPFIFFGTVFFVAGGAFGYYVAFPNAVRFLLAMGQQFMPVITIERYSGFLLTVILGLGLMFELPIVIFLASWIGLVRPRTLMKYFRHAVVLIAIAAAILTPTPDIVNMMMFMLPGIGLYLLGVGAAALVVRNREKAETGEALESTDG